MYNKNKMPNKKDPTLHRNYKSGISTSTIVTRSHLVSIKPNTRSGKISCTKEKISRNRSKYLDKKFKNKSKTNLISHNLRKKATVCNTHHEEVKSQCASSEHCKKTKERTLSNKIQNEKLFLTPIVLLEKLSICRMKIHSYIDNIKVSNLTKSSVINSFKVSDQYKLKKISKNKTEINSDKQISINIKCNDKIISNDNCPLSVEEKCTSNFIDKSVNNLELSQLNNSALSEQIIDKNNFNSNTELNTKKKICIEPETSNHVHIQENSCEKQLDTLENYIESTNTLINIEAENLKNTEVLLEKEIINEPIANDQIIIEKEYQMDLTSNEEISNANECSLEQEMIVNKTNKKMCNDITKTNVEHLFCSEEIGEVELVSIVNDSKIDKRDNEMAEQKGNDDNQINTVDNTDKDDSHDEQDDVEEEEIIFYYINSANEVVRKVDIRRKLFCEKEKKKDEKYSFNSPNINEDEQNNIVQLSNNKKEKGIIIYKSVVTEKKRTFNEIVINDQDENVNINQTVTTEKENLMDTTESINLEKDKTKKIRQSLINNKDEIINIDHSTKTKNDNCITVDQFVVTENSETDITDSTKVDVDIEKEKISQPITIEKVGFVNINPYVNIEEDEATVVSQCISNETDNEPRTMTPTVIVENEIITIESVSTKDGESTNVNKSAINVTNKTRNITSFVNTENENGIISQSVPTENDKSVKINESSINVNDEVMIVDQPVVSEIDKTMNINSSVIIDAFLNTQSTNKEKNKTLSIIESTIVNENEVIFMGQSANIDKDKTINISQSNDTEIMEIINSNQLDKDQDDEIKVEETVQDIVIDDQSELRCDNLSSVNNSISEIGEVKVEIIEIPEDNNVHKNSVEGTTNQNALQNLELIQGPTEHYLFPLSGNIMDNAEMQENDYNSERCNDELDDDSISETESNVNSGLIDKSKAMFISFMEAYHRMKKDISAANTLLRLNGESNNVNYSDIGPEILHISDPSDSETFEETYKEVSTIQKPCVEVVNRDAVTKPVNTIRRKFLLPNGGAVISASRLYGCSDGISVGSTNNKHFSCTNCKRTFVTKFSLRRHTRICGFGTRLHCIYCSAKLKYNKSLIEHLKRFHSAEVARDQILEIANKIIKDTKIKADRRALQSTSMIHVPEFVKLFCNRCGKIYNQTYPHYYRECETCNVPLLVFCRRCNSRSVVSSRMSIHLSGDCNVGRPIKCPHCDFVSSERYNIEEHIQTTHENLMCTKGCGRRFDRRRARIKHEQYCDKQANLRCKFCQYKTKHRSAIKMHMQQHVINNDAMINSYDFSDNDSSDSLTQFSVDENVIQQMMVPYCEECQKIITTTPNHKATCNYCNSRLVYNCQKCHLEPTRSHNYRHVRVHVIRCHGDKVYRCSKCKRRFAYFYDYKYHKNLCGILSTYRCKQCSYKTHIRRAFEAHMKRVHLGQGVLVNRCYKCFKTFNNKHIMSKHVRFLCGIEPSLSCAHCDFRTKTKFSLSRHIQNIHGDIFEQCQFQCSHCKKICKNFYAYENHVIKCAKTKNKRALIH